MLQGNINKDTLWKLFGNVIYINLERNLEGTKLCEVCRERFSITNEKDFSSKYCTRCKAEITREKTRLRVQKTRKNA